LFINIICVEEEKESLHGIVHTRLLFSRWYIYYWISTKHWPRSILTKHKVGISDTLNLFCSKMLNTMLSYMGWNRIGHSVAVISIMRLLVRTW